MIFFFFQAEDGIRDYKVTGVQTCALPISVTFTNKAAEEIGVRLKRTLGERAEEVTRGTLHALCLAILREHADAAGLHRGFGVADEEYQRIVLGRLGVHAKRRGGLLTLFTRRRLQDYRLTAGDESVYREYAAYLARRNMLDFDDLIARTATRSSKSRDRKSTRLNSSHLVISYAVFCLKKKKILQHAVKY